MKHFRPIYINLLILTITCLLSPKSVLAQKEKTGGAKNNNQITRTAINSMMVGEGHKVDTLTLLDRIAVRTNAFDWLLLIPNIGVEFDVKPRNWNRWTVGISARGNWKTGHTYNPSMVYNLAEVRLEGRQYWRTRDMGYDHQTGEYRNLEPHKKYHLWDKAVSIRRKQSRYPSTTFFRGVYVSYMDYSLKLFDTGRQGQAINAGVTWGIVRNLYAFRNGNSLDIEFGIRGGFMYTKNTEYTHDAESDCYPIKKLNDWHLVMHPVINDLSVTLVYRLGKYPSLWKYRYRDDVDAPYAETKRERRMTAEKTRRDTRLYEHVHDSINREFIRIYDMINRGARQQEEAEMKAKEEAAKKKLQQDKEAERQRRAEEKEAEKAAKAAKKEAEQQDEKPANSEAPKKEETEGKEAADE